MELMIRYQKVRNRFYHSLRGGIDSFREGEDQNGLDCFLESMDDLENLLEMDRILGTEVIKLERILPVLQELECRIKNQDIVGMTDLMEFTLYPMIKELAGEDGNENSRAE